MVHGDGVRPVAALSQRPAGARPNRAGCAVRRAPGGSSAQAARFVAAGAAVRRRAERAPIVRASASRSRAKRTTATKTRPPRTGPGGRGRRRRGGGTARPGRSSRRSARGCAPAALRGCRARRSGRGCRRRRGPASRPSGPALTSCCRSRLELGAADAVEDVAVHRAGRVERDLAADAVGRPGLLLLGVAGDEHEVAEHPDVGAGPARRGQAPLAAPARVTLSWKAMLVNAWSR